MDNKGTYELSFVNKKEDCSLLLDKMSNFNFCVLKEGPVKKIKLAYPIKKENFGYFGYLHFRGEKNKIADLKKSLSSCPEILRFLIVAIKEKSQEDKNDKQELNKK